MIYYAPTFLSDAGFGSSSALMASIGISIIYLVMTVLGSNIVDRIGRRRLVLVMGPGSVLSLIGLGIMFIAHPQPGSMGSWLIIVFMLLFMVFNAGGIQVVGWLLGAEMFPLSMRGNATSLHSAMLWGSDLLVTSTALTLVTKITLGNHVVLCRGEPAFGAVRVFHGARNARRIARGYRGSPARRPLPPTRGNTAIVEEEE